MYYLAFVDLSEGPMVVETPPTALGTIDDICFQWIIDLWLPGPDRGTGGRFLLVPSGYDGALPEGGFYVGRCRTHRALVLDRSFVEDDDPAPTVATIKSTLKIYPYTPGEAGTSVATLLQRTMGLAARKRSPRTRTRRGPTCCSRAATGSIGRSLWSRRKASSRARPPVPASTTDG